MLLVRTPSPIQGESLLGYVLRVSQCNGYDSLSPVLSLAEVGRGQDQIPGFPIEKFARVVGRTPADLAPIAYREGEGKSARFKILDHDLGRSMRHAPLRLKNPAFCVQCVDELGYIDAFWDLRVAVACPKHRVRVVRHCSSCGDRIRWSRPRLTKCRCGTTYCTETTHEVCPLAADLMAVVHAKLHRKPLDSLPNRAGFPLAALEQMPFVAFLYMLEVLGEYVLQSHGQPENDYDETVCAAAEALADWPVRYHRMLEELGKKFLALDSTPVGLCRQFGPFYEVMFRSRALGKATSFFKEEFVRFGLQTWGRALIDGKLLRSEKEYEARFVSKTEFARRHRIWAPTLKRLMNEGAVVASATTGTGRARRSIVDVEQSTPPEPSAGAISVREAASYVGLPVSVLNHLLRTGLFFGPPRKGKGSTWYKEDVEAFLTRGLSLAYESTNYQDLDTVKLADVMRMKFRSSAVKAEVVVAIFDSRLTAVARTGRDLGSLLLDKRQVDELIAEKRAEAENSYTIRTAAIRTGLSKDVVPQAIAVGMLDSFTSLGCTRIPVRAVERFEKQYVPLKKLATKLETSVRKLSRICEANEIPVVLLPRPNTRPAQPLLPREMEDKLLELWQEDVERTNAVRRDVREARYLTALRQYLSGLRSTGEPLPRRAGKPNKIAIAKACGFNRNVLYTRPALIELLDSYDQEERDQNGTVALEPLAALQMFLAQRADTRTEIPTRNGAPNLSLIAKLCGFSRDYFYKNPEAKELLDRHMESRTSGHQARALP